MGGFVGDEDRVMRRGREQLEREAQGGAALVQGYPAVGGPAADHQHRREPRSFEQAHLVHGVGRRVDQVPGSGLAFGQLAGNGGDLVCRLVAAGDVTSTVVVDVEDVGMSGFVPRGPGVPARLSLGNVEQAQVGGGGGGQHGCPVGAIPSRAAEELPRLTPIMARP